MKYNDDMKQHFDGRRLLAEAFDIHRNREVRIYMLDGTWEYVGVSDSVDAWIAPVVAEPFSVNLQRIFDAIRGGKDPQVIRRGQKLEVLKKIERRRIAEAPAAAEPAPRRRLISV